MQHTYFKIEILSGLSSSSFPPAMKEQTIGDAKHLELAPHEELFPDDGIFFVPASCAGDDGCAKGDALKLLSVGIVVAAGSAELVVHELLRPNPLEWKPCAWCPSPNTLFPTDVRVLIPRHAVKGRALIDRRAGGSFVLAPACSAAAAAEQTDALRKRAQQESSVTSVTLLPTAGCGSSGEVVIAAPGEVENLRPFVLGASSVDDGRPLSLGGRRLPAAASPLAGEQPDAGPRVVQFAGASPVLWSSLDALRTRAAEAEGRLQLLGEKISSGAKAALTAHSALEEQYEQHLARAMRWTEKRLAERDDFVMRELSSLASKVDELKDATRARKKSDDARGADMEERLARVERNVASLQSAQAQINSKVAAQLADSAGRSKALDAALASATAQVDACNEELASLSEHLGRRLSQFGRALGDLREDLDALHLGGGGPAASGSKRAAAGQLVPRKADRGPHMSTPNSSAGVASRAINEL